MSEEFAIRFFFAGLVGAISLIVLAIGMRRSASDALGDTDMFLGRLFAGRLAVPLIAVLSTMTAILLFVWVEIVFRSPGALSRIASDGPLLFEVVRPGTLLIFLTVKLVCDAASVVMTMAAIKTAPSMDVRFSLEGGWRKVRQSLLWLSIPLLFAATGATAFFWVLGGAERIVFEAYLGMPLLLALYLSAAFLPALFMWSRYVFKAARRFGRFSGDVRIRNVMVPTLGATTLCVFTMSGIANRQPASWLDRVDCVGSECVHAADAFVIGQAVPASLDNAIDLYGKACTRGSLEGCAMLGYAQVLDLMPTTTEATAALLQPACDGGVARACAYLGDLNILEGDGSLADEYYRRACSGGHTRYQACDGGLGQRSSDRYRIMQEAVCDGGSAAACALIGEEPGGPSVEAPARGWPAWLPLGPASGIILGLGVLALGVRLGRRRVARLSPVMQAALVVLPPVAAALTLSHVVLPAAGGAMVDAPDISGLRSLVRAQPEGQASLDLLEREGLMPRYPVLARAMNMRGDIAFIREDGALVFASDTINTAQVFDKKLLNNVQFSLRRTEFSDTKSIDTEKNEYSSLLYFSRILIRYDFIDRKYNNIGANFLSSLLYNNDNDAINLPFAMATAATHVFTNPKIILIGTSTGSIFRSSKISDRLYESSSFKDEPILLTQMNAPITRFARQNDDIIAEALDGSRLRIMVDGNSPRTANFTITPLPPLLGPHPPVPVRLRPDPPVDAQGTAPPAAD